MVLRFVISLTYPIPSTGGTLQTTRLSRLSFSHPMTASPLPRPYDAHYGPFSAARPCMLRHPVYLPAAGHVVGVDRRTLVPVNVVIPHGDEATRRDVICNLRTMRRSGTATTTRSTSQSPNQTTKRSGWKPARLYNREVRERPVNKMLYIVDAHSCTGAPCGGLST